DRDKFECNSWAVKQTGFDPSLPQVPPHQRVQVIAGGPPPGAEVGAGAVTGAVVGAAVSNPWRTGQGALLGAVAGAAIGGIAEAERNNQANRRQEQANANSNDAQRAAVEQRAAMFRRALGACLEGRGYSVR
ncbi:MAG TPA: glycine zipper 2TM domain-containing protein, partial [Steroidobacteraceae bacterium]|nr:glycine zipper 2TM domain-containing protein [Steroidobacteraceae bacterium]